MPRSELASPHGVQGRHDDVAQLLDAGVQGSVLDQVQPGHPLATPLLLGGGRVKRRKSNGLITENVVTPLLNLGCREHWSTVN